MEKEENKDKSVGAVETLTKQVKDKSGAVLQIKEFSNQNISLIFNHILKVCIQKRKEREGTDDNYKVEYVFNNQGLT